MKGLKRSRRRGFTLVESLTAAGITAITLVGGVSVYVSGMMSWAKGEGAIDSLNNAQNPIRLIAIELREATRVQVNTAGTELTYELPKKDPNGDYSMPLQSDGVPRYFRLVNDKLYQVVNTNGRVIANNVLTTDPETNQAYKIFTTGGATIARQVIVQIAASKEGYQDQWEPTRARETICLRNIPQLTR
jgi:type II secretory pathway pseudopilin PulG